MNIAVFCSAAELPDVYKDAAREFGSLLGSKGHTLVWGGSDKGLMKVIADAVQESGGTLRGVSVEYLKHHARESADEMYIAKDLGERKATMLLWADAIVMLVGGIGPLDEVTDVLEQKKHGAHDKRIIVLNTNGFYEGLRVQLTRMESEGFLQSGAMPRPLSELVHFSDTPEDAMRYIESD